MGNKSEEWDKQGVDELEEGLLRPVILYRKEKVATIEKQAEKVEVGIGGDKEETDMKEGRQELQSWETD